ncbi:OV-16 antigen [Trichonephila clavata]|uniref:OV-16 antigen n=1 Tax=Trichonephila clavata TaxID=2740835 RepID=A0A8X6FB10_TRICU|nr:OV-16 antigen [Trichonephila clavata]
MAFKLVYWIFTISSLCISSLQGECDVEKFREKGIVPEIIPKVPESALTVQYTTEIGIDCGVELTANETKDQPGIAFKAANPDKLHTLVMFDVIFPIEISWLRQQPSAFYQFCDTLGVADFSCGWRRGLLCGVPIG